MKTYKSCPVCETDSYLMDVDNETKEKAWEWYWKIVSVAFTNEIVQEPIIDYDAESCCILNTYYCREKKGLIYYKTSIDLLHGTEIKKEIPKFEYEFLTQFKHKRK